MPTEPLDWQDLAARGFPFPAGHRADAAQPARAALIAGELSTMLESADPEIRDTHGYTAAARWIGAGHLDDVLTGLGDTAAARFTHPEIQARTFAPLVLRCVLDRARSVPGAVPVAAVERWYAAFAAWYPAERDTRGWDDRLGWLHAVAHGADAAAAFARALPGRRTELLEACARRMTAVHADYRYAHLEDARLARAIATVLLAPGLTGQQAADWLAVVSDALEGGGPGPLPPWATNTFATLQSLHVHLTRGLADAGVPPHAARVADRIAELLRLPCPWLA